MCVYDFDFTVNPTDRIWEPSTMAAVYGRCDCGRAPDDGEIVTTWVEIDERDDWTLCPMCEGDGTLAGTPIVCPNCGGGCEVDRWDPATNYRPEEPLRKGVLCAWCVQASRLLHEWCDGMYGYGGIPEQITEHWFDGYDMAPFARVAAAARSVATVRSTKWPWHLRNGHRIPLVSLTAWVDAALEREVA